MEACDNKFHTMINRLFLISFHSLSVITYAQKTETRFLSGRGNDQTVQWDFFCSVRMNSNKWKTIEVPSCWELQGFGKYSYGADKANQRLNAYGIYR